MRLLRWGAPGAEKPGLVDDEGIERDLSPWLQDLDASALEPAVLAQLSARSPSGLPRLPPDRRIGACVPNGGKIICVGLNYADHAREAGMAIPTEPVLFMKACRPSGPTDPIQMPPGHSKVDWEIELAVIIGREAICVSESEAHQHVAGYSTFIDMSERSFQLERGGQWVKGKSFPGFAPIGPWLVTPDSMEDPAALDLWLDVNGERVQASNTAQMIFRVPRLISYISHFMPLYPGDVIATGTPPGVGMGFDPPRWLEVGDSVTAGISGLGVQQHRCIEWAGAIN